MSATSCASPGAPVWVSWCGWSGGIWPACTRMRFIFVTSEGDWSPRRRRCAHSSVGPVSAFLRDLGCGEVIFVAFRQPRERGLASVASPRNRTKRSTEMADPEKAILAGGCFWGVQDLIRKLDGVISTRVGYTGGDVPNATYRNHGTHAEAIEITFDPDRISYRDLLEFFFQIHDPTTKDRQGNDVGASYRSAIYYVDDEQRRVAEDTIADVDASGLWPGKVVTEVEPAGPFWEAEPEHQDYLERYPNGYTCHFVRPGWKLPRRAQAAETLR